MRRIDIINACQTVKVAFEEAQILSIFRNIGMSSEKGGYDSVVQSFRVFSSRVDKFTENENHILEIFGLSDIKETSFWTILLKGEKEEIRGLINNYHRKIVHIIEFLPKFIELIKQHNIAYITNENLVVEGVNLLDEKHQLLTVILPENEHVFSQPDRIIKTIKCIDLYYESLSTILNTSDSKLSVVAIDSGSDKSFDFLGAAKVIEAVKELILSLWDRIIFYRERKQNEKIDLIAKSLPIYEKINDLEKSGACSREQCELLRRNIFEGSKSFIETGSILPEFDRHSSHQPRELMAPERYLINGPENEIERGAQAESDNINNVEEPNAEELSEEEQFKQFKKFLEEQKKKPAKKASRKKGG